MAIFWLKWVILCYLETFERLLVTHILKFAQDTALLTSWGELYEAHIMWFSFENEQKSSVMLSDFDERDRA